ncbi:sulfurtransferase-like selenium metabolism protein YedF [Ruminococcaceae bacterium OttesenSCG-928-I18]|nr:sulfurtransferase-like selenium metabolism protein YedF [Ruminococcaceae bacterium OttesenSCG-928-I18]
MQTINALGWECPKPIIHTKQMLDTMEEGTVCTIVDNMIAVENLESLAKDLGFVIKTEKDADAVWKVYIEKTKGAVAKTGASGNLMVLVATNLFGQGSEDLSKTLMKSYLFSLTEAKPQPTTIAFINSGVFLTTDESSAADILTLEASGVEIISCGACLDFYSLKENLLVGKIGNMYQIVEKMHQSDNVIRI